MTTWSWHHSTSINNTTTNLNVKFWPLIAFISYYLSSTAARMSVMRETSTALSGLSLSSRTPSGSGSTTQPPRLDPSISSLTADLSSLSLKSPSKRRPHKTSKKGRKKPPKPKPTFRYPVGVRISSRPSPHSSPRPRPGSRSRSRDAPNPNSRDSRERKRDDNERDMFQHKVGSKRKHVHGHTHARIEPRSRRHAILRRHRVPSPTPTV